MDINSLRSRIDKFDTNILRLLKKRFKTVEKIKLIKEKSDVSIKNSEREEKIYKSVAKYSEKFHLDTGFTKKLFHLILDESRNLQKRK